MWRCAACRRPSTRISPIRCRTSGKAKAANRSGCHPRVVSISHRRIDCPRSLPIPTPLPSLPLRLVATQPLTSNFTTTILLLNSFRHRPPLSPSHLRVRHQQAVGDLQRPIYWPRESSRRLSRECCRARDADTVDLPPPPSLSNSRHFKIKIRRLIYRWTPTPSPRQASKAKRHTSRSTHPTLIHEFLLQKL